MSPKSSILGSRFSMKMVVLAFAVLMLALFASGSISKVEAANGDNLATIFADRTGTACVTTGSGIGGDYPGAHGSVGVGIAFDGTNLLISCYSDNTVTEVSPADGSQVAVHVIAGASSLGALAYDGPNSLLYGCSNFGDVGTIDLTANTFTLLFSTGAVGGSGCFDGLAYDGSDTTIWASGDVSPTVEHYTLAGALIGVPNPVALGACDNSGIAVGGPKLYLANNGCSEIYEVAKDFSASVLLASFPARLEDLECDNITFAPANGAIWSIDAYDNILNAWEIPADQCAFGGGEPEVTITLDPASAENEAGTDHTVTFAVLSDGNPVEGVIVSFAVAAGPNIGEVSDPGECSANADCSTDANGQVSWTYLDIGGLGTDSIVACITNAAGDELCARAEKTWVDTTPPEASCDPTTNPAGKNIPAAPGNGNQGQNQDGYYVLSGSDIVGVASIVVRDDGSAFVSDPFADGDKVKITQAPGVTPSDNRPGPGVIVSHLRLKGDAVLVVTDTSGNVTEVSCLVPPRPQ